MVEEEPPPAELRHPERRAPLGHFLTPARSEADVRCDRIQGGADTARRRALRTEVREGDVQKTAASTDAGSSVNLSLS